MAYDFHKQKEKYFTWQYENSKNFIVPFVIEFFDVGPEMTVLEIGCAEAGVLKAFTDFGCRCTGIELSQDRVDLARQFMEKELASGKINFITRDIYDIDVEKDLEHKYDLIILKDVIEHIPNQELFISRVGDFLNPGGKVFFGFPPWQMPFGGHQQMCENKLLKKLPWFHLMPMFIYKIFLKLFGESDRKIAGLSQIKETGISIERFERISKNNHFKIYKNTPYLFNPIYRYKFKVEPKEQFRFVSALPYFRNFVTTAVYYLIGR